MDEIFLLTVFRSMSFQERQEFLLFAASLVGKPVTYLPQKLIARDLRYRFVFSYPYRLQLVPFLLGSSVFCRGSLGLYPESCSLAPLKTKSLPLD